MSVDSYCIVVDVEMFRGCVGICVRSVYCF